MQAERKPRIKESLTEKYLLEKGFAKPIILVTYAGALPIEKEVKVIRYDLKIDGSKVIKKLEVMFAFPQESYEVIKKGITLKTKIEAQQLQPIEKLADRPIVATPKEYIDGTRKNVCIVMRTGHVLSGQQIWASQYNIILKISNTRVLVYKHGILGYQVESESADTQKSEK